MSQYLSVLVCSDMSVKTVDTKGYILKTGHVLEVAAYVALMYRVKLSS